jgi:hypothetical protein
MITAFFTCHMRPPVNASGWGWVHGMCWRRSTTESLVSSMAVRDSLTRPAYTAHTGLGYMHYLISHGSEQGSDWRFMQQHSTSAAR